jgi:hypothetical protein
LVMAGKRAEVGRNGTDQPAPARGGAESIDQSSS